MSWFSPCFALLTTVAVCFSHMASGNILQSDWMIGDGFSGNDVWRVGLGWHELEEPSSWELLLQQNSGEVRASSNAS